MSWTSGGPARTFLAIVLGFTLGSCGSSFRFMGPAKDGEPSPRRLHSIEAPELRSILGLADDGTLLLGTTRGVRAHGASGEQRWSVALGFTPRRALPDGRGGWILLGENPGDESARLIWVDGRGRRVKERLVPPGSDALIQQGILYVWANEALGAVHGDTGALLSVESARAGADGPTAREAVGPFALDRMGRGLVTVLETKSDVPVVRRVDLRVGGSPARWPIRGAKRVAHLAALPEGRLAAFAFGPDTDVMSTGREVLHLFGPDGHEIWHREVPIGYETTEFVVDGSGNIVISHGSVVQTFGQDGEPGWSLDLCVEAAPDECGEIRALAVGPAGVLYVGHRWVTALGPGGKPLWHFTDVAGHVADLAYGAGRLHVVELEAGGGDEERVAIHVLGGDGKPKSGALWSDTFRPGLGGFLEPAWAEAPPVRVAAPATVGSKDEDLCRWGLVVACRRHAESLAAKPSTAGEALSLLAPACTAGDTVSCESLERIVKDLAAKEPARATDLLAVRCGAGQTALCGTACDRGEPASCYYACSDGNAGACVKLGTMVHGGRGVAEDHMRAMAVFHWGCVQGSSVACQHMMAVAGEADVGSGGGGDGSGVPSPSAEGFETFVAEQTAQLNQSVSHTLERMRAAQPCSPRDACCLAAQSLGAACATLGCARVPGC